MVADLLDENPRKRRILRTLHRLYLALSLPRIQFRSFLGVSMFLPASLSASFLIRPYPARGGLPLPGASRRPPMPPSSNRATHAGPCAGPRLRSTPRPLWGIPRVFRAPPSSCCGSWRPALRAWPPSAPGSSCQPRPWAACRSDDQKAFLSNCTSGGEIICERDSRCHGAGSNPYLEGSQRVHSIIFLSVCGPRIFFLPVDFWSNLLPKPRRIIRTSQPQTVEYGLISSRAMNHIPLPSLRLQQATKMSLVLPGEDLLIMRQRTPPLLVPGRNLPTFGSLAPLRTGACEGVMRARDMCPDQNLLANGHGHLKIQMAN